MLDRHAFRAMGTDVSLIAPPGERGFARAAADVELIFAREERRFSRFRADSELSRVNRAAGRWTELSDAAAALVAFSLDAAERTRGRFDPTVLHAVVAAGYDRDLDQVRVLGRSAPPMPTGCGRWREIRLDGRRLWMPAGVGLDLGGIAKGWTVDLAVLAAFERGLPWVVVNAGGDLRVEGGPPSPEIEIAVDDPERAGVEAGRLRVTSGAVATSSITRRTWGPELHHLIDPRTGLPSDGAVLQATAWAATCAEAEVASKTALLEGEPALGHVPAVLVLRDGRILTSLEEAAAA